jgi:CubicO group peptidase (beta-lactamase class C family)
VTGFSDRGVRAADHVLRDGVANGLWPGLVAAVGHDDIVQCQWVLGAAEDWAGGRRAMTADTVFDVASLTKVLATLPAVLLLVRRDALSLDTPVAQHVPGVDARVRVRHLLTHTSGLPAHRALHATARSAGELIAAATAEPLERPPGTVVAYSDLGFILLGAVIRAVSGSDLPEFAAAEVFGPLRMDARFAPPPAWLPRIAATEIVAGRPVHGAVHDENAAAADGRTGHAGLFASRADVLRAVPVWLPDGPLLSDALRTDAMRDHTDGLPGPGGPGGHRGLGWTCRGDVHDILSPGWGPAAVSHTGFTGTSMAIDPITRRWAVLLSNAVHYGRGRSDVFAARRRFHAALAGNRGADTPDRS